MDDLLTALLRSVEDARARARARGLLEDAPSDLIAAATQRKVCTCAGTAPGYPQHESFCGQPDPDEDPDEVAMRDWQDTHDAPPED